MGLKGELGGNGHYKQLPVFWHQLQTLEELFSHDINQNLTVISDMVLHQKWPLCVIIAHFL